MSEESDQVWESMSGPLRRVRCRRAMTRVGASVLLCVVSVLFLKWGGQVDESQGPVEIASLPEFAEESLPGVEEPRLAVLVYDGEGMRFELMDGEQLGFREMELSLQPVVMSAGGGMW